MTAIRIRKEKNNSLATFPYIPRLTQVEFGLTQTWVWAQTLDLTGGVYFEQDIYIGKYIAQWKPNQGC